MGMGMGMARNKHTMPLCVRELCCARPSAVTRRPGSGPGPEPEPEPEPEPGIWAHGARAGRPARLLLRARAALFCLFYSHDLFN